MSHHVPFRAMFTATEWRLYQQGKCGWQIGFRYCGRKSKPGQRFGYCPRHARMAEQ